MPTPSHRSNAHDHRSTPPRHRLRRALLTTGAFALLATSCSSDDPDTARQPVDLGEISLVAALQSFDRCDDLLAHVKKAALDRVSPYGLDGGGGRIAMPSAAETVGGADEVARSADGSMASPANEMQSTNAGPPSTSATISADAGASDSSATSSGTTGTNNQERDVDEADIVKTDGTRIVAARGNQLQIVTLAGGAPYLTASVDLGDVYGDRLFLDGDRVVVVGSPGFSGSPGMPIPIEGDGGIGDTSSSSSTVPTMSGTALVEVALDGTPRVVNRTTVEGQITDGRMANGTLRFVLTSSPWSDLGFVYPQGESGERAAEASNRKVIEGTKLDDWIPARVDALGASTRLLECDGLYHPAEFSGFSTLSVLTIPDGLDSLTATGVLADGGITYASSSHLYVATNQWGVMPLADTGTSELPTEHTDLHSFSIEGDEPATYLASGRVDGHLLNQYSMSEADGRLRVATTVSASSPIEIQPCPDNARCAEPAIGAAGSSDNRVVVLEQDGKGMRQLGSVGGLGKGEQITSVRFVDADTAYVVTFRQTDPFYVVDLSDPTAPKVTGELKLPGFSSYLHPVGRDLVLGVGSDATDEGQVTGAKLTLFDTSNATAPREVTSWTSGDLDFMVGSDPKAFSWDDATKTAYLPYYGSYRNFGPTFDCADAQCMPRNGVLVVKVADGAITEVGRINHDDRTASPQPMPIDTTTTTTPSSTTTTTMPDSTTIPETTTTTVPAPETTVAPSPETTLPGTASGASSSAAPDSRGAAAEDVVGSSPGVVCDPASCDVVPLPSPMPPIVDPATYPATISRVFVLGDRVITLSDQGLAAHDRASLRPTGYVAL